MGTGNDINGEKRNGNKDRKFRNKDNSNAPYGRKALKNKKQSPKADLRFYLPQIYRHEAE